MILHKRRYVKFSGRRQFCIQIQYNCNCVYNQPELRGYVTLAAILPNATSEFPSDPVLRNKTITKPETFQFKYVNKRRDLQILHNLQMTVECRMTIQAKLQEDVINFVRQVRSLQQSNVILCLYTAIKILPLCSSLNLPISATKSLSDLLDLDSSWPNEFCLAGFDGSRESTTLPADRERDDNAVSTDLALLQEQVGQ